MANNKVVYKVVTRNDRYSFSYFHWKEAYGASKYILEYHKGKTVKAVKGTVGIMCFKTEIHAQDFMTEQHRSFNRYIQRLMIIKVRPIGEIKYARQISGGLSPVAIDDFYERFTRIDEFKPSDKEIKDNNNRSGSGRLWITELPKGTVCYNSVEVLT